MRILLLVAFLWGCSLPTSMQVIGLKNATAVVNSDTGTVSVVDLDTTIYPDRAVFRFYNSGGAPATIKDASIRGNAVIRQYGQTGYKIDDLIDYGSIRADGPNSMEIENEYIIDPTQIAELADWYWKTGRGKHTYTCDFYGARHWFEVGDWYQLAFSYTVDVNPVEDINSLVQIEAVETTQTAGTIGSTRVTFREVEENWVKTIINNANLVLSGSGRNKPTRNVVTVGSATYTGFADYLCDGTADDVQIQAAIDFVSASYGGGTVQLTEGTFSTSSMVTIPANIILVGMSNGASCIARTNSTASLTYALWVDGSNINIGDLGFSTAGTEQNYIAAIGIDANINTIAITECYFVALNRSIYCGTGPVSNVKVSKCSIDIGNGGATTASGIWLDTSTQCSVIDNYIDMSLDRASVGIYIEGGSGHTIYGNTIVSTQFTNASYPIYLVGSPSPANCSVCMNTITVSCDIATGGFEGIYTNASNSAVGSNAIVYSGTNSSVGSSIGIAIYGDNIALHGNSITGIAVSGAGTGYGIYIASGADRTSVNGNIALSCDNNYTNAGTNTTATGNITS
jgi:hypothetical protein